MSTRSSSEDFFGVGMLSANPYASRYQPVHDMRMTYAQNQPEVAPNMPQGWSSMYQGTPLNGVSTTQARTTTPVAPGTPVPPTNGTMPPSPPGPGGLDPSEYGPDGRPYPYPGGAGNPQNQGMSGLGGYSPDGVVNGRSAVAQGGNIPPDLAP